MRLRSLVPVSARRRYRQWRPRLRLVETDGKDALYDLHLPRKRLRLYEPAGATGLSIVARELGVGPYDFSDIDLRPDDVVVDLGAHVGAVATYIATAHPEIRLIAYEPLPALFACLQRNLHVNNVRNVTAVNAAVTGDGRSIELISYITANSGGATANVPRRAYEGAERFTVPSITLDELLVRHGIDRCRILKIDVEGSEHEVLTKTTCLDRIDYIRGEFHENQHLAFSGYSIDRLVDYCSRFVPEAHIRVTRCRMWEGD